MIRRESPRGQPWSATNEAVQASAAFQSTAVSSVDQDWMSSM
ncbi:hypothetical protein J2Z21_003086 [Streptomyces griseochromogenes]|uniref:Transposase n=1 Tax=Streptomyces griseochromogenes TaxID=68214 RepID=A0ABS4LRY5_9ACTN|nr:hypothetical protein [Streptomyces griseochromogenes]MBP2050150.1 hypothetical protein [Streptomyces griseochromogenes]